MKRKLMLIGGGLVFASSFPMIAASCDGKTKEAEKEIKEPVKKEDSKKVADQPKLETTENDKTNKENIANSMPAETTNNLGTTAPANETAKRTDTTESDLEGVRASTYIYDVWARNIYKYEPKTKDDKSSKSDLDAVKASNYIYDVWARDIFKYEPTKKPAK
ncbi:variable surface lipoprotein [Mycoplasmopsis agalactiae]|nr:variable surface lipoprotein [Mycoplasmopsis agalactiae]MCE6090937.1 variable surface lipoprotein [Mycoplasmopsis agalactiae]